MDPLATQYDVQDALGMSGDEELSESQAARVVPLLALVSRRFRLEAQRLFTPGTYTHTLRIHAGAVRLDAVPDEVSDVLVPGVAAPEYTVDRNWVLFTDWESKALNGLYASVTYTVTAEVPDDVVAAVAGIVARALTVDPQSAVAQSTQLSTPDYSQSVAPWARSGLVGVMNGDDVALARTYRYPVPPVIVHQMGSRV